MSLLNGHLESILYNDTTPEVERWELSSSGRRVSTKKGGRIQGYY